MKTNPIGIRFEIQDLDFIKKRENLKTNQKVVDFLLSEYCKIYRVEKTSVFAVEQPKILDAPKAPNNYFKGESPQWEEPKIKIRRSFENYALLKRECENEDDWMQLKEDILNADNLSSKQKVLLTN